MPTTIAAPIDFTIDTNFPCTEKTTWLSSHNESISKTLTSRHRGSPKEFADHNVFMMAARVLYSAKKKMIFPKISYYQFIR